jgi:hypothetical protein
MTHSVAEAERWLDARLGGQPVPPLIVVAGVAPGHLLRAVETPAPLLAEHRCRGSGAT